MRNYVSISLQCIPSSEFLGHEKTATFWGIARLYDKVAATFYIPNTNTWEIKYLHILTPFIIGDNWW